jgi:hypothetical protein
VRLSGVFVSRLEPSRFASATVTDGDFEAIGSRKALQPREEGMVRSVAAQDARARVGVLSVQLDPLPIRRARLKGEQDETSDIAAPPNLIDVPDEDAAPGLLVTRRQVRRVMREDVNGGAERARLARSLYRTLDSYDSSLRCAAAFQRRGRGPKRMSRRRCDRLC